MFASNSVCDAKLPTATRNDIRLNDKQTDRKTKKILINKTTPQPTIAVEHENEMNSDER